MKSFSITSFDVGKLVYEETEVLGVLNCIRELLATVELRAEDAKKLILGGKKIESHDVDFLCAPARSAKLLAEKNR